MSVVELFLPPQGRGPARIEDPHVLNRNFYASRTKAPSHDLLARYGARTTLENRNDRLGERWIWQGLFEAFKSP